MNMVSSVQSRRERVSLGRRRPGGRPPQYRSECLYPVHWRGYRLYEAF
jgi:hypothetical protein